MYFIVSWDIPDASWGNRWTEANQAMRDCFAGYVNSKPLSTFYMVRVGSTDQYKDILKNLQMTADKYRLNFVSVAVSSYSLWGGWLPIEQFSELQKVTGTASTTCHTSSAS